MVLEKRIINFGIDKVFIAKITADDELAATYGGLVRLEGVQDLKITETSEEFELSGDNGTVDIISRNSGYEVEVSHGVLTLEELQLLQNGELIEDVDGNRKYVTKASDSGEYFGLIGVVENSNTKVILAKVKAISIEIPYSNLTHSVVNIKAKALKRNFDGVMRVLTQDTISKVAAITDFDV